ncbi:TonB-dependent receptor, partial [Pseudomaricurvus sp.]|uniref:TonB-dependent receptor n=1 Tax=Pseudomaricurvus sp. TaxID=2004510 RepID=UPI003F6CF1D4
VKTVSGLSLSVLALSIAAAHSTYAQEADKGYSGVLEEVTVTAQRRTERSLDVPISITALSADQLGKGDVQQLGDIMKLTPGVRFDTTGGNTQPTIRGVGSAVVVAGGGSSVAVYTDGFYSPNPMMADMELMNIESVQVLKGPQGTLFGRNSTGGAVLVTTTDPSSDASIKGDLSYGSYNAQRYQVYATGGPSDDLGFDIAAVQRKGDGFVDNIVTGADDDGAYDNWAIRVGARWDITDRVTAVLRYAKSDKDDATYVANSLYEDNGRVYSTGAFNGAVAATEWDEVSNDYKPQFTLESEATQLKLVADLGFADLTSYTQVRNEVGTHNYDFDGSGDAIYDYIFDTHEDVFSQEFLLSSNGEGRLQWTAGLFYFDNDTAYKANQASYYGGPFVRNGGSGVTTETIAVFGDMTYELQDNLFLTLGARYSEDEVSDAYFIDGTTLDKVDVPGMNDSQVTPRIALRYEPNDHTSLYASYSEGFKSGIINVGAGTLDNIEVDPEHIKAYEVGYKYNSGDLMFDVAAFYYDYKDLQVASYVGASSVIRNAANSTVYGVDAQMRFAVTEQLEFNVGGTWLDATYGDFEESQTWSQCTDPVFCTGANAGLFVPAYEDASDNEMQRSPEFTATLGVNYFTSLLEGTLNLSGNLYHTSDFYFDSSENYAQDSYQLLSLRAEWTSPSERYNVAVYGDNLTDEHYRNQVIPQFYGVLNSWGAPRTVGVSVGFQY